MNYNTIKQLLKSSQSVDKTQYINVKNGEATANNLDIVVRWKTDLKDGLYFIDDLKAGLTIPENIDIEPPESPEVDKNNFTVLDNDIFYAVGYCDCEKYTQNEVFEYIHIKYEMEATDGHIAFRKKMYPKNGKFENEKLIHKDIINLAKKLKMQSLKYAENENHYCVFDDNITIITAKKELQYPDIDKILPEERKYKSQLKQWPEIYKTYKPLAKGTNKLVVFDGNIVYSKNKSVYSETDNNIEIEIGFNIDYMNILQKTIKNIGIDLEMEYETNTGHVLFRNKTYTFLIFKYDEDKIFNKDNFTKIPLKNVKKPKTKQMPFLSKEINEIARKKKISKKQAMNKIQEYINSNMDNIINKKLTSFLNS